MVLAMVLCLFAGCAKEEVGSVYYLNFKPEQDAAWQTLAKAYTEETGVEVKVVTAAEGTYEETLTAEIDKDAAPTLFQVSGTVGLESWKDYCLDLADSEVYAELTSDDFALKEGDAVYGVAYVYEGYGIIVNTKLLAEAGYKVEDIKSYAKLKEVAEDITARKDDLGFAAFASAGLASSSSWRFSGHLANMPLYYEFEEDGVTSQPATIKGTYLENFKNIW
ncbi:MAG: extracellular solute-binding protein, partial [Acutalibacteraceae bacterium]|nr:extracellular solute-binding protein [Acutalibacteraceae bacterium]